MRLLIFVLSAAILIQFQNSMAGVEKKPGRIALVQYTADLSFGDVAKNQHNLTTQFVLAVAKGANIIVFPEGSSFGYEEHPTLPITELERKRTWCAKSQMNYTDEDGNLILGNVDRYRKEVACVDVDTVAESVPEGPTTAYWSELAQMYKVYVVVPIIEKMNVDGEIRYANTAIVVGPEGYIASHRKTNQWQNEVYIDSVAGTEPTVINTPYGNFGILICNGVFDPGQKLQGQVVRKSVPEQYVDMGVDAVLFPSDWVEKSYEGGHGYSLVNSFDFLAGWRNLDFFAADDNGSGRTGYFPKSQATNLVEIKLIEVEHLLDLNSVVIDYKLPIKDGLLLLDIDYSNATTGPKVELVERLTL